MTPRPLCDAERAAIAARYGVAPHLVPSEAVVCPPRTYAIDPTVNDGWQVATAGKRERMAREARMAALKRREQKAAEPPKPKRMVMVSGGARIVPQDAKDRKNARRREKRAAEREARGAKPLAASNARERIAYRERVKAKDLEWLRLVREGMSQPDAAVATGRSAGQATGIAARVRAMGHDYPRHNARPKPKGPMPPTERDMAFLALLREGMARLAAAVAVGCPPTNAARMVKRLKAAGHDVPASHEAEGRRRGAIAAVEARMARRAA